MDKLEAKVPNKMKIDSNLKMLDSGVELQDERRAGVDFLDENELQLLHRA